MKYKPDLRPSLRILLGDLLSNGASTEHDCRNRTRKELAHAGLCCGKLARKAQWVKNQLYTLCYNGLIEAIVQDGTVKWSITDLGKDRLLQEGEDNWKKEGSSPKENLEELPCNTEL